MHWRNLVCKTTYDIPLLVCGQPCSSPAKLASNKSESRSVMHLHSVRSSMEIVNKFYSQNSACRYMHFVPYTSDFRNVSFLNDQVHIPSHISHTSKLIQYDMIDTCTTFHTKDFVYMTSLRCFMNSNANYSSYEFSSVTSLRCLCTFNAETYFGVVFRDLSHVVSFFVSLVIFV